VLGVGLALGSSILWGVSDFLGGVQARRLSLATLMLFSQGFGLALLAVVLAVRGSGPPALHLMLPAVAAGLGGVIALSAF
jgi:hypothetical protein